jgi:hypothetical protein
VPVWAVACKCKPGGGIQAIALVTYLLLD